MNEVLKELRRRSRLKLKEAGQMSGVNMNYISCLENGVNKNPSAVVMYRLAKLYETTVEDILIESGLVDAIKPAELKEPSLRKRVDNLEMKLDKIQSLLNK